MAKTKEMGEDRRSLSNEALNDQITELQFNLKKLQFSHSVNPIENPMSIRSIRRQIARLRTEQGNRANK
jgi:large subunit ribosomal protein L29